MIKLKDKKVIVILIVIAGLVLVAVSGFFLNSYLVQQSTLKELEASNKSLKVMYDKLLKQSGDNVENSYFKDRCSYSYRGPYEKVYSCGAGAKITLKKKIDVDTAASHIQDSAGASKTSILDREVYDETEVRYRVESWSGNIECFVGYGEDQITGDWVYSMFCRGDTPGPIPGYEIE